MPDAAASQLPAPAHIALDAKGRLAECSAAARVLLGVAAAEAPPLSALCPAAQPDGSSSTATWRAREAAARGGLTQCFSWQFRRRDGAPVEVLVELEAAGECCVATLRDLSALRNTERALRDSQGR